VTRLKGQYLAGANRRNVGRGYCCGRLMEDGQRERFDTGLIKIRHEIKRRLVTHGFFGSITFTDIERIDQVPSGSTIEIVVKGKSVGRSFSREDVEGCRLRVGGAVLAGIVSMVNELSP
jgi:hypothetical protein